MNKVILMGRLTRDPEVSILTGRKSYGDRQIYACGGQKIQSQQQRRCDG